jgi:hypothetical protein
MTWVVAASALTFTVATAVGDRRSATKRKSLDDVTMVPWTFLSYIGSMVTLFAVAMAIKLQ